MNHYGSSIRWVVGLDLLKELQHANGSERNPEIRPAGEVKLCDQSLRLLTRHITHLNTQTTIRFIKAMIGSLFMNNVWTLFEGGSFLFFKTGTNWRITKSLTLSLVKTVGILWHKRELSLILISQMSTFPHSVSSVKISHKYNQLINLSNILVEH